MQSFKNYSVNAYDEFKEMLLEIGFIKDMN